MKAAHTILTSLTFLLPPLLVAYLYAASTNNKTQHTMATKPSMLNSNGTGSPSPPLELTFLRRVAISSLFKQQQKVVENGGE